MKIFIEKMLGFRMSLAPGWSLVPNQWVKNFRMKAAPTSEELAALLAQATTPFLYLQLPQQREDIVTPTVQCVAKPLAIIDQLGSISNIVDVILPTIQTAYKNFTLVERSDEMIFAGSRAAYAKISFTILNEHACAFDCLSEMYFFTSSKAFFMMGLAGCADETLRPALDFEKMRQSIRLS